MMPRLSPNIKIKEKLNIDDYKEIRDLQKLCGQYDQTAMKLELDYKLSSADRKRLREYHASGGYEKQERSEHL